MKKLLLTAVLVTATLAVGARRSPREILNNLYPTLDQARTEKEIITDVKSITDQGIDGFGGYVTAYILHRLEKECKSITHFGPGFPNAVEEEQKLKNKCEQVLQCLINRFEERMSALSQENKIKNEILFEEIKDLQKKMLQPFDDVIEYLKETNNPKGLK